MSARRSISMVSVWLCALLGGLLLWSAPALAQRKHAFSELFGSEGSGDGQLMRPGALAVNEETGDVYVIDRGNSRVEIFSPAGVYVGQFNGSASPTGAFSWPGGGKAPEGAIAIDNSTNPLDPSKGDVYVLDSDREHSVVDKFSAAGIYIGQVTGTSPTTLFDAVQMPAAGLAVDPEGALWVQVGTEQGVVDQFSDAVANEYVSSIKPKFNDIGAGAGEALGLAGFAFDSDENFYMGLLEFGGTLTFPTEFSETGGQVIEKLDGEETTALAVDLSSNDIYVDHGTSVAAYSPSGYSIERFGSAQMEASAGIAVDSATGTLYTSNAGGQQIDVFTAFVVPDATTGSASSFAETSVTVSGVVDPDGLSVTSCVFEYGTSTEYGQSVPCSPSPGSGSEPVTVTAQLKGLERLTKYHFRLNVSNANGSNAGQDRTFTTPEPVALSEESVSEVSSTSALFSVQVNPGGADTTYQFEYGPSEAYGESVPVPAGDLGSGTSSEPVSVAAQDLMADTTYHVRVVASNLLGTMYGPDQTFTTQVGGGAFALPDGREWEMVSPPNKHGALIERIGGYSDGLIQASVDGSAITYPATGPVGTGVGGSGVPIHPAQVLSRRGAGDWSSEDITTPRVKKAKFEFGGEYKLFSDDLSRALLERPESEPLSAAVTEATPYLRNDISGGYTPLVTPTNVTPPGTAYGPLNEQSLESKLALATPDLSHVVFESPLALTANAVKSSSGAANFYEWSAGGLQLVNVLPDGTATTEGAYMGLNNNDAGELNTRHLLSSDGSRVFFETEASAEGEHGLGLYMRNTVTEQTVQIDTPAPGVSLPPDNRGEFEIASANGSEVFFLDEQPLTPDSKLQPQEIGSESDVRDLYVYDTETGSLTDLSVDPNAGELANVQSQVMGASEDGSIVYFVATGKLAEGAESGKDNLYVESKMGSSWSPPRLVAVLSLEDSNDWATRGSEELGHLTSRVSANGRYLTFMSDRSLTDYDNRDAASGQPDEEVFLYDEATGRLSCVSCNRSGVRPAGVFDEENREQLFDHLDGKLWVGRWVAANIPGGTEVRASPDTVNVTYLSRVLSNEGRMFFDSSDALAPQDTNGTEDVYEYEPEGVGNCSSTTSAGSDIFVPQSAGCVGLISSGTSSEESVFLDASETGDDVFLLTAARLVPQDVDTSFDVYDAHLCSPSAPCVSEPVLPPPCSSGDACKAAPSPQPAIFGAPASATFSGAGNVSPPTSTAIVKSVVRSKKCKKGEKLKHGKCVKQKSKRRTKVAKPSRGGQQ